MKALIIVDIQNDFLDGGALAVPQGNEVVPVINRIMSDYDIVVATQDWHPENHGSFAKNHRGKQPFDSGVVGGIEQCLWAVHCVQGTFGAEIASQLNTQGVDTVVRKGQDPEIDSYSGFYDNGKKRATGLTDILRDKGVRDVYITGLATDYCVKFTALDAISEGFKTYLIPEACRGVNLNKSDVDDAITEMQQAGVLMHPLSEKGTVTLYRPTGENELAKVEQSGWKEWPPRLPEQPIFYPVTNKQYAIEIASQWNTKDKGNGAIGYVTEFQVSREFINRYEVQCVGAAHHTEYWIPAEDVEEMNSHIIGTINVVGSYKENEIRKI